MEAFEYEILRALAGRGVAVAQILGMTTDPELVAALNPGLPAQNTDRGLLEGRSGIMSLDDLRTPPPMAAATPLPMDMAYTERRVGRSTGPEAALRSAPIAGAVSGPALTFEETYVGEPQKPRSALAVFGWILLLLLLAGAIGMLLFVALGNKGDREVGGSPAAGGATDARDAGAPVRSGAADGGMKESTAADAGAGKVGVEPGGKEPGGKEPGGKDGLTKPPGVDGPTPRPPEPTSGGPARSRKEATKLIDEARQHGAKLEWEAARALYQRVASSKYRRADGYVGLARVAFETRNLDDATKYAKKAMAAGATTGAWMILGHAYFKMGRYADALEQYEKVLKKNPGDKEALTNANLARRKLGK
ncbi:MAG TPA: tetratricopeptide repeat protein [Kofleriaceae bacterium]|nr:tetratricopeptide repeat protein [Kofleriaceae bacterium]